MTTAEREDLNRLRREMAARRRRPGSGLIHHSDHGVQYASLALTRRLEALGIAGSMGSVGDALDNAVAESFYYFEGFYNRRRRHSSLGSLSPYDQRE
mgnify:CR=1 FL=1